MSRREAGGKHRVRQVVFAYSDLSHNQVMHLGSRALACGADFRLIGPARSMLAASRPVISVCAVRTGCGKDSVVRRIAGILKAVDLRGHPNLAYVVCNLVRAHSPA